MPTELEKFQKVNAANSIAELKEAIEFCAQDGDLGRTTTFPTALYLANVEGVVRHEHHARLLTRQYGIRQQALYLRYYQKY